MDEQDNNITYGSGVANPHINTAGHYGTIAIANQSSPKHSGMPWHLTQHQILGGPGTTRKPHARGHVNKSGQSVASTRPQPISGRPPQWPPAETLKAEN